MTKGKALVSICIPAFNAENYIEDTLHSALESNTISTQIIIVDDASTDRTFEIATRILKGRNNCICIRNPVNLGAANNWNKASTLATGKYLKLLCSDDTLIHGSLEKQIRFLEQHSDHAMVSGCRKVINNSSHTILSQHGRIGAQSSYLSLNREQAIRLFLSVGTNPFGEPSATLIKRESLLKAKGWSRSWSYMLDIATYLEIARFGRIGFINEAMSTFRISRGSWSYRLATQQLCEANKFIDFAFSETNEKQALRIKAKLLMKIKAMARKVLFEAVN